MCNRLLRLSITSIALLLLLSGCLHSQDPTPVVLKLNWKHGVDFLGYYVAKHKGFYAAEGLSVTIEELSNPSETNDVFDGVAEGRFDFSGAGLSLIQAQARGVTLTAVANINKFGPGALFFRADSGITTPADLAGRTIVIKNETWKSLVEQLLAREGMTLSDVKAVPGGYDMSPFLDGKVEVWAGFINDDVVRARMTGLRIGTFPLYEYGARGTAQSIYTSKTSLREKPEIAEGFVRASIKGWDWAVKNPTEALEMMLEMYPDMAADREFHKASFDATIPLIVAPGTSIGEIDCDAWRAHALFVDFPDREATCTTQIYDSVRPR